MVIGLFDNYGRTPLGQNIAMIPILYLFASSVIPSVDRFRASIHNCMSACLVISLHEANGLGLYFDKNEQP